MICPHCGGETNKVRKLTSKDIVIIEAICEGLGGIEIAKRVGLSVRTVKWRVQVVGAVFAIPSGKTRSNIRNVIAALWSNPLFREGLAAKGLLP